jgi:nickel transport protein
MKTADGTLIESATTDEKGSVCFNRPKAEGNLLFVVEAGQGHQADFTFRAEDWPALTDDTVALSPPPAAATDLATADISSTEIASVQPTLDINTIRAVVRQELATQLGPINKQLVLQSEDQTPGLREIIGGLGWLAGVFGLAFWWSARRRRAKTP